MSTDNKLNTPASCLFEYISETLHVKTVFYHTRHNRKHLYNLRALQIYFAVLYDWTNRNTIILYICDRAGIHSNKSSAYSIEQRWDKPVWLLPSISDTVLYITSLAVWMQLSNAVSNGLTCFWLNTFFCIQLIQFCIYISILQVNFYTISGPVRPISKFFSLLKALKSNQRGKRRRQTVVLQSRCQPPTGRVLGLS